MYTIGELFAGIGGFSLAFHATGQACTSWFVEREAYPQQVLAKNFPGVPIHGDIYDCHDLPQVDIITAGFPCQPFSVAGLRQGDKDERYLVPEMFRVIQEVKPRVVLFENVPGFASIADGDTFKQFCGALAKMGFHAEWGHLRASDVGAAHRRERWFCVAYRASHRLQIANQKQRGVRRHVTNSGQGMADRNPGIGDQSTDQIQTGRYAIDNGSHAMGNAASEGLEKRQGSQSWQTQPAIIEPGARPTESRLGRVAHGLSARLDRHRWPARPGQHQHHWEPPRVTDQRDNRTARLKALGNAVVPQVVYPIAQSICEWLAAQDVGAKVA